MNIDNFEQNIDPTICDRGQQYFMTRAVRNLEKESGSWHAEVEGSDIYEVQIEGIRKIKAWDCDCPYDHGPICKHVVAVLYAIRATSLQTPKKKSTKPKDIDQIFTTVPKDDLLQFFRKNLRYHPDLKNKLLITYADKLSGSDSKQYETIIKKMLSSAQGRYGFIDYQSSRKLGKQFNDLITKSAQQISSKNYLGAYNILKPISTLLPSQLTEADDSSGTLSDILYVVFDQFEDLLSQVKANELKETILKYLLTLLKSQDIISIDMDHNVTELILRHYKGIVDYQKIEVILLSKLEQTKASAYGEYQQPSIIWSLMELYESNKLAEKYEDIQQAYMHLSEIRQISVTASIDKKDYTKAKELVAEGIQIAQQKDHPGSVNQWLKQLVNIAKTENNKEELRQALVSLYHQQHTHDVEIYAQLKKTYPKEEWAAQREALIKQVKKMDNKWGYATQWLAALYKDEKLFTLLLKLIQKKKQERLIFEYYKPLSKKYPSEVLDLLKPIVLKRAEMLGRSNYRDIADLLQEIKKIKGGKSLVETLVKHFRQIYIKRPAMMEELRSL